MNAGTRAQYRQRRSEIAAEIAETDDKGKPRWTYDEIGKRRGITRERVRQIAVKHGVDRRRKQGPAAAE